MDTNILTLIDSPSGTTASIVPDRGFNCFRYCVVANDRPTEILWSVPDFEKGAGRPSGSGIPLLFPFPGRIQGDRFQWKGREYPLQIETGRTDALHGFVMTRPWRVLEHSPTFAQGEFHAARDDPSLLGRWPSDFRITASYRLAENSLQATYRFENPGNSELPFGFGTHAYFRVPLGGEIAGRCRVQAPVARLWELENMHATGRAMAHPLATSLASGISFDEAKLDTCFEFATQTRKRSTRILDPESGISVVQECDDFFPYCVAFTPPHRSAICLEPYSCVPDCFRLHPLGIQAGLRLLAPGESITTSILIRVEQVV